MEIQITNLRKSFVSEGKTVKALDGVDLRIPDNTIFTLLGPSGCGKTTLLRCIVGLENPDEGEIRIGEEIVYSSEKNIYVPTEKRKLGMVFQTYAIWPHMNVFNNVAYPLQNQHVSATEIRERVAETLRFVQLEGYEGRPATALSGGQQQRVALARALVARPGVILFDEPLSNLDAKLREETRKELKKYLTELRISAVYVTHDRVEALALSDTIAVMRAGHIIEIGDPRKIYFNAETSFVADFIGRSSLVRARVTEQRTAGTLVECSFGKDLICHPSAFPVGSEVTLCLRPEFVRPEKIDGPTTETENLVEGLVETMVFVGDACEAEIRCGSDIILARMDPESDLKIGERVKFTLDRAHAFLVADTGRSK